LQRRFRKDPRLAGYVTADKSAPEADIHIDITAMTFGDSRFDAIVCCHVLELILDDRAAMREMIRVLRPGGLAYIQVPFASEKPRTPTRTRASSIPRSVSAVSGNSITSGYTAATSQIV
jgi:ubiquinone/menaquinone biosynthesis C-methylase UbiE